MTGEADRLSALYREYGPVIYWRCRSILGDDAAAEDATQETFVRIHRHLDRAPGRDEALAWIYRIATNHCLNEVRNRRRRPEPRDTLPDLPAGGARLDDALADRQLVARIIERVDEKLRAVAWLHHVDGLEQAETGRLLGVTRQTVASRLELFRERARKILGEVDVSGDGLRRARAILEGTPEAEDLETAARFQRSVYPRTVDAVVRRARRRRWLAWSGGGAALVLAAAAVLLVARPREPDLRAKGASVRVVARRGDAVFAVGEGTALRPGDAVRFTVSTGTARRVLVASVDGRGVVSVLYPSTAVPAGETTLPGSILLDDAPGPERVHVFLSSDREIDEAAVRRALAEGREVALDRLTIVLHKEGREGP